MARARQLVLDLQPEASAAREDFVVSASNAAALAVVDRWPDWPSRGLVLVGPPGAGKSHLAAVWAAQARARRVAAAELTGLDPLALLGSGAAAVEDAEPDPAVEAALFHLLNLVREQGAWLLLTLRKEPSALGFGLPDLVSRLRSLPLVRIELPDDALLEAVAVKLFADAGVEIEPDLARYLVARIERSVPALRAAVAAIDRAALAAGRPVTRALAAHVLREAGAGG